MKTLRRFILMSVVAVWLLAGCATPPEPFEYQKNNDLKPGPGIFTGKEGVYTIYGTPPKPAGHDDAGASGEEASEEPNDPAAHR